MALDTNPSPPVSTMSRQIEGIQVVVATPKALYRLKKGTVRPIARQDAASAAPSVRSRGGLKPCRSRGSEAQRT